MNKYLKFMAFAIMAVSSLVFVACSDDNDEIKVPSAQLGTLIGDDEAANAAVADLRLVVLNANWGSYYYSYNENGNLESISDEGSWSTSAKDNFKIEDDYYSSDISWRERSTIFYMSNNRITSSVYKQNEQSGPYNHWVYNETTNFEYNSKGQLASIKVVGSEQGTAGNSEYQATTTFTYASDNRIVSVDCMEEYNDDGKLNKYRTTVEYEYSSGNLNKFYQYTPQLIEDTELLDNIYIEAFVYIGLFGKASSYIPTKSTYKCMYEKANGEQDSYSDTNIYSCSFNSNGTISRADDVSYTYANIGTRSFFETSEPAWRQANVAKNRRVPFHNRMRSMREHHQQLRDME